MNKYNISKSARHPERMKRYADLIRIKSVRSIDKKLYDNKVKTSLIEQIAQERGARFVKINLSQLEEVGD